MRGTRATSTGIAANKVEHATETEHSVILCFVFVVFLTKWVTGSAVQPAATAAAAQESGDLSVLGLGFAQFFEERALAAARRGSDRSKSS